jgi:hypothetical protein
MEYLLDGEQNDGMGSIVAAVDVLRTYVGMMLTFCVVSLAVYFPLSKRYFNVVM